MTASEPLPPRPAEAHALEVARPLLGEADPAGGLRDQAAGGLRGDSVGGLRGDSVGGLRVLATTVGRGQAAQAIAVERPDAAVTLWCLDLFPMAAAVASWASPPPGLRAVCAADAPPGPYDLAVVPLSKAGEAELSRDILQAALHHLRIGGRLVAAIDNARDNWLREQLAETGEKVRVRPAAGADAVAYVVEKTREPSRERDFSCRFVFRDRERLLTAVTRPGVFAHRRIDPGARHLLNAVDLAPETRVVDIGCGSGCVTLGLASRDPTIHVHALDAAARAVECTRLGSELNGLGNVTVALECEGRVPEPGSYDLAVANPPYYSDFRIAELFVTAARAALAPGGTLLIVTKQPGWYLEHLPLTWQDVAREEVKHYHLIEAVR
jgi:16S rRNA (guanine1207-N2)-methyltransferase